MTRCDAHHDGHDCSVPQACTRALLAMCERIPHIEARITAEQTERRQHRDAA